MLTEHQGQLKLFYSPISAAIAHEFQHLKTILKHVNRNNFLSDIVFEQYWSTQEEYHTICVSCTSENNMNREVGLPERLGHKAFSIDKLEKFLTYITRTKIADIHKNPHYHPPLRR